MKIKVFADTICGWCFIGHTRLNKALKAFPETKFEIEHVPFQLNTDMPKEGIERDKYLEIKFGGKDYAAPMYDNMTFKAKESGLNFISGDFFIALFKCACPIKHQPQMVSAKTFIFIKL